MTVLLHKKALVNFPMATTVDTRPSYNRENTVFGNSYFCWTLLLSSFLATLEHFRGYQNQTNHSKIERYSVTECKGGILSDDNSANAKSGLSKVLRFGCKVLKVLSKLTEKSTELTY